ncbi:glycosyltransferase family 2 protein [Berryella wangjianweii]|uniref:Glycosyltransferase family 2 protein n=1 Tax=Berryella wangjianweii TaxID=2734634 RepID=A0A6M8J2S1_9ACTN|nr:glycosyltransferase family A protein [Berryella wangjianweii]QKF06943.1 glycosyltransferase family 2 protein [Berryella wangjianweii]
MKTISFALPCYNSAAYMDTCIESILAFRDDADDIEILVVDDGSTKDDTAAKADEWARRHPDCIRAIHQENGGHGAAVNAGLAHARGVYFKVVDSDDWLDEQAMRTVMDFLRQQARESQPIDMVVANYVYEKVFENATLTVDYRNVLPVGRTFGWDEVGSFKVSQFLLMHSVIYRTQLLRDIHLELPRHTFYVDNIFVYVPLPHVRTIRYFDVDMYRYFIGREGQSVNEEIMRGRMDQQIRVTKQMIDEVDLDADVSSDPLRRYMESYLSVMLSICTVFLRMTNTPQANADLAEVWDYLRRTRPAMYARIRGNLLNRLLNLPGEAGRRFALGGYRVARKLFKFN